MSFQLRYRLFKHPGDFDSSLSNMGRNYENNKESGGISGQGTEEIQAGEYLHLFHHSTALLTARFDFSVDP